MENGNQTVRISKYGRRMSSERRRYLYLYISPFHNDLETGIHKALDALDTLLAIWMPPLRRGFLRPDMWWEHIPCAFCRQRVEYEIKTWQTGKHVWRRGMCLRHWFVHHLSTTTPSEPSDLMSNRPISITADTAAITYSIKTANYEYHIRLNRELAQMDVNYKGKMYRFSFKNHLSGFPHISSYMNILIDAYNVLETFRDFLANYILRRKANSNVVINDVFTLQPAPPTEGGCDVCRL